MDLWTFFSAIELPPSSVVAVKWNCFWRRRYPPSSSLGWGLTPPPHQKHRVQCESLVRDTISDKQYWPYILPHLPKSGVHWRVDLITGLPFNPWMLQLHCINGNPLECFVRFCSIFVVNIARRMLIPWYLELRPARRNVRRKGPETKRWEGGGRTRRSFLLSVSNRSPAGTLLYLHVMVKENH